jgi:acetyl esterase
MALDNATAALMAQVAQLGRKPLHESTVQEARALGAANRGAYGPGPDMARVEDLSVDTDTGSFPIRVLRPHGDVAGVIVYYHGGGWVLGEIDGFEAVGRALADRAKCTVVLVDYRMAPEYRFPTAVDDSYAALEWAAASMDSLAGAQVPLIVAGDSAGGNLSAVMALRSRDRGGPRLALQVLIYPVVDADLETESYLDAANQLMLTRNGMIWFWDHYVPDAQTRSHPDASPIRADDLSGLAPAIVLTAEHDVLRDEGEAYARRLSEAGVPVRFQRVSGQMHGFFPMLGILPGSAAAVEYIGAEIQRVLSTEDAQVDEKVLGS